MSCLLRTAALTVACFVVAAGNAWSAINIEVFPAFAPHNASAAFGTWVDNAIGFLDGTRPADPSRTLPSHYELVGPTVVPPELVVAGDFNSWRGQANPTSGWDGPGGEFTGEFGNRIHFSVRIWSDDLNEMFSLRDVAFEIDSDDPQDTFDFPGAGNPLPFLTGDYRASLVGIDHSTSTVYDGSNPAAGTTLVHEILYVGIGTAYDATGEPGATNQEKLNNLLADIDFLSFNLSAGYAVILNDQTVANGSASTMGVPEPAGLAFVGLLGLVGLVRRRRRS